MARAGCGAFFGKDHPLNFSFALEGPVQDSDRAELRSLLRVAKWTPVPTEYLCDNEAVVVGFAKLLSGSVKPWVDRADLWDAVRHVLIVRGWSFLQVTFVKGHATTLDIGLGRATLKEAAWNVEADRLAVAGAALPAFPADKKRLFKRQATITRLTQLTLLDIHEARAQEWTQRQVTDAPARARAPDSHDAEADAAPVDAPRNLHESDVFARPQLVLPRYCWKRPETGNRFSLPPLPERIGAATSAKDRAKGCPDHLVWRYGYGFIEPFYWFWASLEWVDKVTVGEESVEARSFCELTIAFQLLTGIVPGKDATMQSSSMHERVHFFSAASNRLAAILGQHIAPEPWLALPDVLRRLRFQHGPGVGGRFSLPRDYWQHYCNVWLRAHLAVPIVSGKQRQMKWIPNFVRPPPPLWRSRAPIGFEAARAWAHKRDPVAALAATSTSACGSNQPNGQVQVCQPSASPRRRLRGKQNVNFEAASAPIIITPVPKARAASMPVRLTVAELNPDEAMQVEGLQGVARNQMLKLLLHSRDAAERGKHFVVLGHDADTIGQLKCRDCSMEGRWSQWQYFAVKSNCKRRPDGTAS